MRGHLYELLNNRLYRGEVSHKGEVFPGQHEAIIDAKLWDQVQKRFAQNATDRSDATGVKHPSLLAGLLYDDCGNRFTPTHTSKGPIRRRYYVCQALLQNKNDKVGPIRRLPAQEIELLVKAEVISLLNRTEDLINYVLGADATLNVVHQLATAVQALTSKLGDEADARTFVRSIVRRAVVGADNVQIIFDRAALAREMKLTGIEVGEFVISVPARLKRCGRQRKLIIADSIDAASAPANVSLVKLLKRAFQWEQRIRRGESVRTIADEQKLDRGYVTRVVRLAFLAPDIVEAILEGRHRPDIRVKKFFTVLPMDWAEQRQVLGFPAK